MAKEAGGLAAISNPFSPDVFADEAVAFEVMNGTVRITFGVVKMADPVPPSGNQLVVVGRLVMPFAGAERLVAALHGALDLHGSNPSETARGGDSVQ